MTFGTRVFFVVVENLSGSYKFHSNLTRTEGTVHDDRCTVMIVSHGIVLRMENVFFYLPVCYPKS